MPKAELEKVAVISIKLTHSERNKIIEIAESMGLTPFRLLNVLLSEFINYFDENAIIDNRENTLLNCLYDDNFFSKDTFNLYCSNVTNNLFASEALIFADKPEEKGKIYTRSQAILINQNGESYIGSSYYDNMLELLLSAIAPETNDGLQKKMKKLGCKSIFDTMKLLVDQSYFCPPKPDIIHEEIEELFSDIRIESGEKVNNDDVFYRKRNRSSMEVNETCYINRDITRYAEFNIPSK